MYRSPYVCGVPCSSHVRFAAYHKARPSRAINEDVYYYYYYVLYAFRHALELRASLGAKLPIAVAGCTRTLILSKFQVRESENLTSRGNVERAIEFSHTHAAYISAPLKLADTAAALEEQFGYVRDIDRTRTRTRGELAGWGGRRSTRVVRTRVYGVVHGPVAHGGRWRRETSGGQVPGRK